MELLKRATLEVLSPWMNELELTLLEVEDLPRSLKLLVYCTGG